MDILKKFASGMDIFLADSCKNVGCIWSGPDDLAELMNNFCQSVFTVEVDSQNAPTLNETTDEKLSTIQYAISNHFFHCLAYN
jgi:hypothetical protein